MRVKPRHLGDLANQPAKRGVRLLAISMLQEAENAFSRLSRGSDERALHDFRVGLRRLRSHIRNYRPWLRESVSRKQERRLRDIARASNPSRDLEVLIERLQEIKDPTESERAGIEVLGARFTDQLAKRNRKFREDVLHDFPALGRTLRVKLSSYTASIDLDRSTDEALGHATVRLAAGLRADLRIALETIASIEHQEEAHSARIAGKNLRYLFEPFAKDKSECEAAVQALRRFQDEFGHLNDVQVMLIAIEAALAESSAEQQVPLAAAHERMHDLRAEIFKAIRRNYLDSGAGLLLDAIQGAERCIGKARNVEIERKFLLKRFPRLRNATELTISQGYLPGKEIRERVRMVESAEGRRYYRTLKAGSGISRFEVEEETTEDVYKRLFPLTKGQRVRKRRSQVQDNGVTWEIDHYLDRKLVIAEVELESPDTPIVLPPWLRSVLEREITGERAYENSELAK